MNTIRISLMSANAYRTVKGYDVWINEKELYHLRTVKHKGASSLYCQCPRLITEFKSKNLTEAKQILLTQYIQQNEKFQHQLANNYISSLWRCVRSCFIRLYKSK